MKKVKNLEVNLKKLVAIGASILTIGTMAGCAKTEIKEEITQNPVATQPQEEPEEVVLDPNAPLFDITDEEVFNQKVDELFNEINGMEFYYLYNNELELVIDDRKYAEMLLILLNIDNATPEQLKKVDEWNDDKFETIIDFTRLFGAVSEYNLENSDKVDLSIYSAKQENAYIIKMVDSISESVSNSKDLTEEQKSFIEESADAISNNDYNNDASFLYNVFISERLVNTYFYEGAENDSRYSMIENTFFDKTDAYETALKAAEILQDRIVVTKSMSL